jgi:hypothetical protein
MARFSGIGIASRAWWLAAAAVAAGCAVDPTEIMNHVDPVGPPQTGLHVVGNQIQNDAGQTVVLHGVNRSGTEYKCVQSGGLFDGPADIPSLRVVASWRANAVRVPLNEDCWLGINGVPDAAAGDNYKQAIRAYVALLEAFHIVPILDLHWAAPGTTKADRLQPMPDADNAPTFWADVATTFTGDTSVVFELYNEPFPDRNRDTDAGWQCWRDGCMANLSVPTGGTPATYQAAGLQMLVDAVRSTGSTNVLLLGGLQYSNALTQWLTYKPVDPTGNLGAAWHVYNFNGCANETCWDAAPTDVAAAVPIVVTEFGQNDCAGTFVGPFMQWLDGHGIGYLAWSWNAYGPCQPQVMGKGGQPWPLVTSYTVGLPNGGYAQSVHDHFLQVAVNP